MDWKMSKLWPMEHIQGNPPRALRFAAVGERC